MCGFMYFCVITIFHNFIGHILNMFLSFMPWEKTVADKTNTVFIIHTAIRKLKLKSSLN